MVSGVRYYVLYICIHTGVSSAKDITFNDASNSSLKITWSPPDYFSNDIPPGSSISYDVLVTDDDGDVIVDTPTTNTFIEVVNITTCDTFSINVTAILAQYTSNNNAEGNGSKWLNYLSTLYYNYYCRLLHYRKWTTATETKYFFQSN